MNNSPDMTRESCKTYLAGDYNTIAVSTELAEGFSEQVSTQSMGLAQVHDVHSRDKQGKKSKQVSYFK